MEAKKVDKLGYGDCKALTNYTRALLKAVGVDSYYTVIYGDINKKDMIEDFVSMQGNHIILSIPNGDRLIHLECTSQTDPFGFLGNFTDDRLALIVKRDGGEIIRTNSYHNQQNSQITTGNCKIDDVGNLNAIINLKYKGIQYAINSRQTALTTEELKDNLKARYSNLNGLIIEDIKLKNDKDNVEFTESLKISVPEYLKKIGDEWILNVNAFNQDTSVPKRYKSRKYGFEISKGYYDEDTIEIELPIGKAISFKPEKMEVENKFGKYSTEIVVLNPNKIIYTRKILINKGKFTNQDYEHFRLFKEQISKNDNSKIIIK